MFRIKTDIRQYKCETKDKVEKLIRNWVIRPSDLIYDADGKEWAPIGVHPAFVNLFGAMDEQEKNTPDTVVTTRSQVADEAGPNGADEVTMLVGRPLIADSEADEVRQTDVFDQEEIASSLSESEAEPTGDASAPADAEPAAPPKAPAGVELPANDGEVTMMTERTLDLLKITDEDEAAIKSTPAPQETESAEADEEVASETPAELAETSESSDEPAPDEANEADEGEADDEVTGIRERLVAPDEDDEPDDPDEEQVEGGAEADEVIEADSDASETSDSDTEEPEVAEGAKPSSPKLESGPKLGRHNLPEELFATNEISSPEVQEQLKRLDELGELDPSEPAAATEETEKKAVDWPARLSEDSAVDEAWDVVAEDLRTTEELDAETKAALQTETSEGQSATDEVERDDFDEPEDSDSEELEEIEIVSAVDFVSDGYKIPLPYEVRPSADDIRRGLPQGRVSRGAKDKCFPAPEPKKLNEIHRRTFDLTTPAPRDQTAFIIVALALLLVVITIGVASC